MIESLALKNRSYRCFDKTFKMDRSTLENYIDIARLTPSSGNLQPLKYFISVDEKTNSLISPCLRWAMYIKEWGGPTEEELPSSYIIMLKRDDSSKEPFCDAGIAAQTILLRATEQGLGGCILRSIDKKALIDSLKLAKDSEILLVIALGKPKEEITLVDIDEGDDIKYWRNDNGIHHVPKRKLEDVIIN